VRTPDLSGAMLPVIRDGASLHHALDLGYRQVLMERGSLLAIVGPLAAAARQGIAIFVNLDAVEGLAPDSAALAFLATDLGFSGVMSVKSHLLRDASRFRLRTVQRIHAIDSTGLETGLSGIVAPSPYAIAIAPGVAVPRVMAAIRAVTSVPVWGTGFITSVEQANEVLDAGADVVSSARGEVWRDFSRISVRDVNERGF
jgi:glycerol uptake operon antiterminator